MNLIEEKTKELAVIIKNSEEYKLYKKCKDDAYSDDSAAVLLKEYNKLQFEAQTYLLSGNEPSADTMDKLKKLTDILAFNPKITSYFTAKYTFDGIISNVYRIIGDSCDVDMDFMNG